MKLLTDEEIGQAKDAAARSYSYHRSRVRGQMVTELDDPEYHLARAIEAEILKRIGEPVADYLGKNQFGTKVMQWRSQDIAPHTPLYAITGKDE